MYLRQKCSDGSVIKTILKPRLAAAASRQYVYVRFSRRKIPRSSACTISEKAFRFRHPNYNPDRAQKLISSPMSRHLSTGNISYPNPCTRFWVILLTDRQTDRQTNPGESSVNTIMNKDVYIKPFCRAMRCISAVYVGMRCLSVRLSVCPSVCHVRGSCQNDGINMSSKFFTIG